MAETKNATQQQQQKMKVGEILKIAGFPLVICAIVGILILVKTFG